MALCSVTTRFLLDRSFFRNSLSAHPCCYEIKYSDGQSKEEVKWQLSILVPGCRTAWYGCAISLVARTAARISLPAIGVNLSTVSHPVPNFIFHKWQK